jgi:hypothetical protein
MATMGGRIKKIRNREEKCQTLLPLSFKKFLTFVGNSLGANVRSLIFATCLSSEFFWIALVHEI